jgi:hypothetical protein
MARSHKLKAWPFIKEGFLFSFKNLTSNLTFMAGFFVVTLALSWAAYAYTPTELSAPYQAIVFAFLTLLSFLPLFVYGNQPDAERPKNPFYFSYFFKKEALYILLLQVSVIASIGFLFGMLEIWSESYEERARFVQAFENASHILVGAVVIQLVSHLAHHNRLRTKTLINHFVFVLAPSLMIFIIFFGLPFLTSRLFIMAIHIGLVDLRAYGHMGASLVTSLIVSLVAYWSLCGVVASRHLYHHLVQLVRREA